MDLLLSPQDLALQKLCRAFARSEVLPVAAERDRRYPPEEAFPWHLIDRADALGLRTLTIPKEMGGMGAGHVQQLLAAEEIAYGDLGVAVSLDQTWRFSTLLTRATTEEQRGRYLRDFMTDPRALLALAITEPESGTDGFLMHPDPKAGPRMSVRREGEAWVLNGTKLYISNGGLAKYYFVFARTAPERPMSEGLTCFLVPLGAPGFTIGEAHSKLGRRLLRNGELILADCRLPAGNMVGEWNGGLAVQGMLGGGALIPALGPARLAYDLAREAVREAGAIGEQRVQMELAEMYMDIEAGRTFLLSAAWHAGKPTDDPKRRLMAKVFASEAAIRVCRQAMNLWGEAGALHRADRPTPEKCWRDVLSYLHGFGTNPAVKIKCASLIRLEGEADW